jgi:hypothetical protein
MRAFDNGSMYTVTVSEREVDDFNRKWPGSTLRGRQSFQFDKRNGDLVDRTGEGDGSEAVALSQDAQTYGKERLKIK